MWVTWAILVVLTAWTWWDAVGYRRTRLWLPIVYAVLAMFAFLTWAAQDGGVPIFLSPITAWEVGQLVARGRVNLALPPLAWFQAFKEAGFGLAELTAEILIDSSFLPGPPLRDPADRIIAATARARGYRVMTRDRPILELAAAGHINAIAC